MGILEYQTLRSRKNSIYSLLSTPKYSNKQKKKKKRDNDIKEIKKNPTNFAKFVISVVWTGNDCIPTIHLGYIYRCIGRGVSLCSSNYPKIWNSSSTCTAGIPGNRSTHTDPSRSACAHINRNKSNITSVSINLLNFTVEIIFTMEILY